MKVDGAICSLLDVDPSQASFGSSSGFGMSSASTSKITTKLPDGSKREFFIKTGQGDAAARMFKGEHMSLTAIRQAVPTLCPRSFGHGSFKEDSNKHFLITDFIERSGRISASSRKSSKETNNTEPKSLAQKLAKLHSTPAPIPEGFDSPQFGFPVPTCCGNTAQENTFSSSWADFYANHRLRFIGRMSKNSNGEDQKLDALIEQTCTKVVPWLLGDDRLNGGQKITPVVVHGDLWAGNATKGKLPGMDEPEDVVFDSSACYAHNEFELGIMRMFGGFGSAFEQEYHSLVPKTEPIEEYEDRIALYELYHHLNHHALFGGGYRSGAMQIMKDLVGKYEGAIGKSEL